MMFCETGRAIIASVKFKKITPRIIIIHATEESFQSIFILAACNFHSLIAISVCSNQIEVVKLFRHQIVPSRSNIFIMLCLPVESSHDLYVVSIKIRIFVRCIEVSGIIMAGFSSFLKPVYTSPVSDSYYLGWISGI